jgi:hypothetical protein
MWRSMLVLVLLLSQGSCNASIILVTLTWHTLGQSNKNK